MALSISPLFFFHHSIVDQQRCPAEFPMATDGGQVFNIKPGRVAIQACVVPNRSWSFESSNDDERLLTVSERASHVPGHGLLEPIDKAIFANITRVWEPQTLSPGHFVLKYCICIFPASQVRRPRREPKSRGFHLAGFAWVLV